MSLFYKRNTFIVGFAVLLASLTLHAAYDSSVAASTPQSKSGPLKIGKLYSIKPNKSIPRGGEGKVKFTRVIRDGKVLQKKVKYIGSVIPGEDTLRAGIVYSCLLVNEAAVDNCLLPSDRSQRLNSQVAKAMSSPNVKRHHNLRVDPLQRISSGKRGDIVLRYGEDASSQPVRMLYVMGSSGSAEETLFADSDYLCTLVIKRYYNKKKLVSVQRHITNCRLIDTTASAVSTTSTSSNRQLAAKKNPVVVRPLANIPKGGTGSVTYMSGSREGTTGAVVYQRGSGPPTLQKNKYYKCYDRTQHSAVSLRNCTRVAVDTN